MVYVEMVFAVRFRVKKVESIGVEPSVWVTAQVNGPHYAVVRLPELVTSVSSQLKTPAAFLMLYENAAALNFAVLIVRVSVRQGLVTKMVKSCVVVTEGKSVYHTLTFMS